MLKQQKMLLAGRRALGKQKRQKETSDVTLDIKSDDVEEDDFFRTVGGTKSQTKNRNKKNSDKKIGR